MSFLFCFGFGYCAAVLAKELASEGWRVEGTHRTPDKGPHLFTPETPLDPTVLQGVDHVLATIPPGPGGDPCLTTVQAMKGIKWLGYLSTTGVYGNRDGGWVDEGSALRPSSERSRRRVEAERQWLAAWRDHGLPVHIFRLAGIYGPGRNVLEDVRAGKARRIVKPGHVFSRIHVEDIVQVLKASMAKPRPGAVYNVCDDEAAEPGAVVAYASELLGQDPPPEVPLEDAGLSAMGRSFWADNKRVSNRRIKEELGVTLKYPDYRSGLKALL